MFIITIDGLAASGKSSISRSLSRIINFQHIDVGLLFRALAFHLIDQNIEESTLDLNNIPKIHLANGKVYLNEREVTNFIKGTEVTNLASIIGSNEDIKKYIYETEKELSRDNNSIISGRDTGLVFPDADLKFFINTSLEKRAQRRFMELLNEDNILSYQEVLESLLKRDKYDMEKGSLSLHKDVIEINNSDSLLDVLENMLIIIGSKYNIYENLIIEF